jgi:hypothetical protein
VTAWDTGRPEPLTRAVHDDGSSRAPDQFQPASEMVCERTRTPSEDDMTTIIGWVGAALVLCSYAQTDTTRLRQINLLASVAMLTFDLTLHIWPSVVLEVTLGLVNATRLMQLRTRRNPALSELPCAPQLTLAPR